MCIWVLVWVHWMRMCSHDQILKILTENRIDAIGRLEHCTIQVIQVKMKKIIATDENQIFFKKEIFIMKIV